MDLDKARQLAADLVTALTPPPVPITWGVKTVDQFNNALRDAKDGDTIRSLVPLSYPSHLVIQKSLSIRGDSFLTLLDGATVLAPNVSLSNITMWRIKPQDTILTIKGDNAVIDSNLITGDVTNGAQRGILANAANFTITNNAIDYCARPQVEGDTQCILMTDRSSGLIDRNSMYGGSETIMIGGDDPTDDASIPHDITITNNLISSREEWMQGDWGCKSRLELKTGRRITIQYNKIRKCWGGRGQDGYAIAVTIHSQYGRVPSQMEDITITDNEIQDCAAVLTVLGRDYNHPSGVLTRFTFANNVATGIDCRKWEIMKGTLHTGSDKVFLINDGPDSTTIENNKVSGANVGSGFYLNGKPKATKLDIIGNVLPKCKYGLIWGNNVGANAWSTYVESGLYSNNSAV